MTPYEFSRLGVGDVFMARVLPESKFPSEFRIVGEHGPVKMVLLRRPQRKDVYLTVDPNDPREDMFIARCLYPWK